MDSLPTGMRVVVVDDDPAYLKRLEMMLVACSYKVTACNSARGALELLEGRKEAFDILITEVHLPDMDGFQLLEHVRHKFGLPVILMSYDDSRTSVLRGLKLGVSEYMLKPLRMEELRYIWQHSYLNWIRGVKELERYCDTFAGCFANEECAVSPCKKRKQMDEKPDVIPTHPAKKARIAWTTDLEDKFVQAANQIGLGKATSKKIQELMNVSWLTLGQISSHLQKYRNDHKLSRNKEELCHRGEILQQQPSPSMFTEVGAAFDDSLPNGGQISLKDYESSSLLDTSEGEFLYSQASLPSLLDISEGEFLYSQASLPSLLDISEGEFLYSQASQPISSSTVTAETQSTTESQSFASCSGTDVGSSQDTSLSNNLIYTKTKPDEVIQVDWSVSLDDLEFQWTEYDQGSPISAMHCR